MEIRQSSQNGVVVLTLHGRLDELATGETEQTLMAPVENGAERIVLDLADVEYVSSSGMRVLVAFLRAVQGHGGALKLCALSPFVAEVFEISNLSRLFEIHPDQDAALHAFGDPAS